MRKQSGDDIKFLRGLLRDYLTLALGGPDSPVHFKFKHYRTHGKETLDRISNMLRIADKRIKKFAKLQAKFTGLQRRSKNIEKQLRRARPDLFETRTKSHTKRRGHGAEVKTRVSETRELRKAGKTVDEIRKIFGVSRVRVYQYIKMDTQRGEIS